MTDTHQTRPPSPARPPTNRPAPVRANSRCRRSTSIMVGRNDASDIDAFTRDLSGFHKADSVHYDALLHGCVEQAERSTR